MILWENRVAFAIALLGGSENISGTSTPANGMPYPDNTIWRCVQVDCDGEGMLAQGITNQTRVANPTDTLGVYQRAKITASFAVPEYNNSTNNVGEQELDFSVKTFPTPNDSPTLIYADTGYPVTPNSYRSVEVGIVNFTQTVYNLAVLPVAQVCSLINNVNSTLFYGNTGGTSHGVPTGQVKFNGGRSKRKITPAGNLNWDVTYSFSYCTQPWNFLPEASANPANPVWQPTRFNDGTVVYPASDLNQLFLGFSST